LNTAIVSFASGQEWAFGFDLDYGNSIVEK
jgi:hypothetical protein